MNKPLTADVMDGLDHRRRGTFQSRNELPSGSRSGQRWHVIATYAQAERQAVANLTRQGYETYLPLVLVIRRDRVLRSLRHHVEIPLFPAYAFCRFDPDTTEWRPIRNTPGVFKLLTDTTGRPEPLADASISALQASDASRRQIPEDAAWRPGAPCTARHGALSGFPSVVVAVDGPEARISVMIFGALRDVLVPTHCLASRDEA